MSVWWTVLVACFVLHCLSVEQCDRLDVQTGRRDSMNYGSNRGWYWPWSALAAAGFVGSLVCLLGAIQS